MIQFLKKTFGGGPQAPSTLGSRGKVEIKGVCRQYPGADKPAMSDVNLTIEPGEFVVIVGPSGCGKSTLLSMVAGLAKPDQGQVYLDGKLITSPGPDRAMVFQEHGLFPWLTVSQNIEFGLKMAGVPPDERREASRKALDLVHLSAHADKFIHQLSGGMKQRVAIARCLVMDPAVLLMDEPFAALDAQTRTMLHEQMQELYVEMKKTVIFVTHSVAEAVRLADRIIVMHANPGRVRRDFRLNLPHPRDFDASDVAYYMKTVRKEIDDEVNAQAGASRRVSEGAGNYEI